VSHPTVGLDDVVHQRFRLGILAILCRGDRVEFGYLQQALDLSAGNLSRHLTTLVNAKLISVEKGYQGRRPRTWVRATRAGRRAYGEEMIVLRSLLALADVTPDEEAADEEISAETRDRDPGNTRTTGADHEPTEQG
jgi:predicted ArsR family transcriptional regulator